jgi:hypothetical protein
MDEDRRKFLAAFMACPVYWDAVSHIDESIRDSKAWEKAKAIYKIYMESYVANMPLDMSVDPASIHIKMVSAHAVALASVLAKFV